jgi:hypothetical protein
MPSTATIRNRLEKQAAGENSNTWGGRLNSNVIDLVDEAMDGVTSIVIASGTTVLFGERLCDRSEPEAGSELHRHRRHAYGPERRESLSRPQRVQRQRRHRNSHSDCFGHNPTGQPRVGVLRRGGKRFLHRPTPRWRAGQEER